eukprot:scaffold2560_cov397-Prasinococcus_capsulatus_cf.AAC.13
MLVAGPCQSCGGLPPGLASGPEQSRKPRHEGGRARLHLDSSAPGRLRRQRGAVRALRQGPLPRLPFVPLRVSPVADHWRTSSVVAGVGGWLVHHHQPASSPKLHPRPMQKERRKGV